MTLVDTDVKVLVSISGRRQRSSTWLASWLSMLIRTNAVTTPSIWTAPILQTQCIEMKSRTCASCGRVQLHWQKCIFGFRGSSWTSDFSNTGLLVDQVIHVVVSARTTLKEQLSYSWLPFLGVCDYKSKWYCSKFNTCDFNHLIPLLARWARGPSDKSLLWILL